MEYLKACQQIDPNDSHYKLIQSVVGEILEDIQKRGEEAVREYSEKYDHWSPANFRLNPNEIQTIAAQVPEYIVDDIRFAQEQVRKFAEAQRKALLDVEVESLPGVTLGHKNIPIDSVGVYVPGGKYPLVSSVQMGVIPAKVAGVRRVVACTPPNYGVPPAATVAAMEMAGVDEIYILGGVQAIGAMAFGMESMAAVDMIVGPGNAYVAEAKRQVFGKVGIDLLAGPSEVLVIADGGANPKVVAADLAGQAEHGTTSPACLLTTDAALVPKVEVELKKFMQTLPSGKVIRSAWQHYGQIILVDNISECLEVANQLSYEHVEVLASNPEMYLAGLKNYGSLFLGPETTVPYGDMVIGTNHILPTGRTARFSGGLWVGKFLKTVTYQRCTPEASQIVGKYTSRLSELEGLWGHKAQADLRLVDDA